MKLLITGGGGFVGAAVLMFGGNGMSGGGYRGLLALLGVAAIYRDRIGVTRMTLIGLGFVGAVLVAQPERAAISDRRMILRITSL